MEHVYVELVCKYQRIFYIDVERSRYSNFRFFAEMLLADTLPRDIEGSLLTWHHAMGGRLGESLHHCPQYRTDIAGMSGTASHRSNSVLVLSTASVGARARVYVCVKCLHACSV